MSVVAGFNGRREPPVSSANIQKMLDENVRLIHSLMAHQRCGAVKEAAELQQALHRNLVFLATIADRTTTHTAATAQTSSQPAVGGSASGPPVQGSQPQFSNPIPANVMSQQPMTGVPMAPGNQPDRSVPLSVASAHPGQPTSAPQEQHIANPPMPVAAPPPIPQPSGVPSMPQTSITMHAAVYPPTQLPQPPNGLDVSQQDVSGAPHGMSM